MDFPMCAFKLGPIDQPNHFYVHRTRVVFPRHAPLRRVLQRTCPGLSPSHQHVALKGSREGTTVTRCTEAGAYAPDFVQAVVMVLQSTLVGSALRGGPVFQPQRRKMRSWRSFHVQEDPTEEIAACAGHAVKESSNAESVPSAKPEGFILSPSTCPGVTEPGAAKRRDPRGVWAPQASEGATGSRPQDRSRSPARGMARREEEDPALAEAADADAEDAGAEDAGAAGAEEAGTEDAGAEAAGAEDAGAEDAGAEAAGKAISFHSGS